MAKEQATLEICVTCSTLEVRAAFGSSMPAHVKSGLLRQTSKERRAGAVTERTYIAQWPCRGMKKPFSWWMKHVGGPMLTQGGQGAVTISAGNTVASVTPSFGGRQVSVSLHSRDTNDMRKLRLLKEVLRDVVGED